MSVNQVTQVGRIGAIATRAAVRWQIGLLAVAWLFLQTSAVWAQGREADGPPKRSAQPSGATTSGLTKQVRVTGEAAGTDGAAVEEATQRALRMAVEAACGTFIQAQTDVENFQTIYDQVILDTAGYVTRYERLGNPIKTADGTTQVKILAEVSTVRFERAWAQAKLTIERAGNPRVMIFFTQPEDGERRLGGSVENGWIEFFVDNGVQVMSRDVSDTVKERDITRAAAEQDVAKLSRVATQLRADVVIIGRVDVRRTRSFELEGQRITEWTATLTYQCARADDAEILSSGNISRTAKTMAEDGTTEALEMLANVAPKKGLGQLLEAWRKRQQSGSTVRLTIDGIDAADWNAVSAGLKTIEGITQVRLREVASGIADVEMQSKASMPTLVSALGKLKVAGLEFRVVEATANRISVKAVNAAGSSRPPKTDGEKTVDTDE